MYCDTLHTSSGLEQDLALFPEGSGFEPHGKCWLESSEYISQLLRLKYYDNLSPSPAVALTEGSGCEGDCGLNAKCLIEDEGFTCMCLDGFVGSSVPGNCQGKVTLHAVSEKQQHSLPKISL